MTWKGVVVAVILLAMYGFGMFKWGAWRESGTRPDIEIGKTLIVHDTVANFPTAHGQPAPTKVIYVHDTWSDSQVDSLLASGASKDSIIRALSAQWYAEQHWSTTKDSAYIVGRLHVTFFPPNGELDTAVLVDSLAVPTRVIEILKTVETSRIEWGWTVAAAAIGILSGAILVHQLEHK